MAIFNDWEYSNRYTAGQTAMDSGNWRMAFDCFKDCKGYLERTQPWNEEDIKHLEELIKICNNMFK